MIPKLVRDRIPDRIRATGVIARVEYIQESWDLRFALILKLQEELDEYKSNNDFYELVDIYEVLLTLWRIDGQSVSLDQLAAQKRADLGGFERGILLLGVAGVPNTGE